VVRVVEVMSAGVKAVGGAYLAGGCAAQGRKGCDANQAQAQLWLHAWALSRTSDLTPPAPRPPARQALLFNARDGLLQRSIAGGKSRAEVAAIARDGVPEVRRGGLPGTGWSGGRAGEEPVGGWPSATPHATPLRSRPPRARSD
jgi:hypothetical protein